MDPLGFGEARHGRGVRGPSSDGMEHMAFFTLGEQHGGRHPDRRSKAHARRKVRDANQLIGRRVRQRLDQHAVHYGEDRGGGTDAKGERQGRGGCEGAEPVT